MDLAAGSRIGPYLLEERIGQGGMAAVYRAFDPKLQRRVALKLLRDELEGSAQVQKRFQREAQAAARLKHPGLVEIYDVLEIEGRTVLVMEYIEGRPLDLCALDRRIAVDLVRRVAVAVSHAHRHGVVHRDLKPGNILVDDDGEPHVVDFGLAHLVDSQTRLTRTGSQIGTPMYMAPEQVSGKPDSIDVRTDVYALGCILYELLAGKPPFRATTVAEIYAKILNEDPEPPTHGDLATICLRAMAKEPVRRYEGAAELAEDLRRWLAGEPILARPPSVLYRMRRRISRNRVLLASSCTAILAATALALLLVPRLRKTERELENTRALATFRNRLALAKSELHRGQVDPEKARAELLAAVEAVPADTPEGRALRARGRFYLGDLGAAEREADPALLARIHFERFRRARVGTDGARPSDETQAHLRRAKEALAKAPVGTGVLSREDEISDVLIRALVLANLKDDVAGAVELLRKAAESFKAEEYFDLLGSLTGDEAWFTKAVEIAPGYAGAWFHRAMIRKGAEALRDFDRAIGLDPRDGVLYAARGAVRENLDDFEGAIADCTRALEIDPGLDWVWFNRGTARLARKEYPQAIADFDAAIGKFPRYKNAWLNRGLAKFRSGTEGAYEDFSKVVELDPKDAAGWYNRGLVMDRRKRYEDARGDFDRAVQADETLAEAWYKRGLMSAYLGDDEAALGDFTRAIELLPDNAGFRFNRGVSYTNLRRFPEAIADYTEAIRLSPEYYSAYANRGVLLFLAGDAVAAAADFDAALARAPEDWPSRARVEQYYREAWQDFKPTDRLRKILATALRDALKTLEKEKGSTDQISVTLLDLEKQPEIAEHRGDRSYYPASVIKLCYMAASFQWGKIDDAFAKDLRDMMGPSSNRATQRIVDRLCGTEDGPELGEKEYAEFAKKRNAVNEWLKTLGLKSTNACQKTYDGGDISPRDTQFLRSGKKDGPFTNRNATTTRDMARLLWLLATERLAGSGTMLDLMKRDLATYPDDRRLALGGVPEGSKVWAKVGWVSTEAHEASIVELPNGRRFILVVFTTGRSYNGTLIAEIARGVSAALER